MSTRPTSDSVDPCSDFVAVVGVDSVNQFDHRSEAKSEHGSTESDVGLVDI
jgi:hypothetical protein